MFTRTLLAVVVGLSAVVGTARSDEFLLATGGRLEGELTNPDESPRERFVVKTAGGATVVLTKKEVVEHRRRSVQESEYETVRHTFPDTVAGQAALAAWCKEHRLTEQRKEHLLRVLELAPNDQEARAALGYLRIGGQWRTHGERMTELGKVQYKGEWFYPQEIEVLEQRNDAKRRRQEWTANLKRWRDWLGTEREAAARTNLDAVDDPAALPALLQALEGEAPDELRAVYMRAVARIGTFEAQSALAARTLHDGSAEIRAVALDLLTAAPQPAIANYFIQQLRSKDNVVVNRAAYALARFKDARAVGPLIDALVTRHTVRIVSGTPGGGLTASNGPFGGGLSTGSSTQDITHDVRNQGVLDALLTIIGGQANYQFNVEAWKHWSAGRKKSAFADARRG